MIRLDALADALGGELVGDGGLVPRGVVHDSRRVVPGDLFVATVGAEHDGHRFVTRARARGAVAAVVERRDALGDGSGIVVACGRRALALAARQIYGDPTATLCTVGVTGTNGKTTVVETLAHVLAAAGARVARMGTLGTRFEDLTFDQGFNTPEADEVMRIARKLGRAGATHWLLEATSHGLAQHRLDGVAFDAAAFTNLSRDHLDLHRDEEAYAAAKARLFTELSPRAAAVLIDDAGGRAIADAGKPILRVSTDPQASADVRPTKPLRPRADGWCFEVMTPTGPVELRSPRIGHHEAANLLVVLALASLLGHRAEDAAEALATAPPVPGRFERIERAGRVVLVDYAHSPDALEHALRAARLLTAGKLSCVFGCGGERDAGKRPLMGAAAARLADRVWITSDNPRREDPAAIASAVAEGAPGATVSLDRRSAIAAAIAELEVGDVALVAGRGHEVTQFLAAGAIPFDDRAVVRALLEESFGPCD